MQHARLAGVPQEPRTPLLFEVAERLAERISKHNARGTVALHRIPDDRVERIRLLQDISITKKKADVEQKINDLNIVLDLDIPYERSVLQAELETERVTVDLISPLEQVGRVAVSAKPVRPRKARAIAILTVLSFFGSFFVVLVWEYIRNNRVAIMAPRKSMVHKAKD